MATTSCDESLARHLLEEARIPLRLAAVSSSGYPAIVSLWSHLQDGRILCATKREAYIVGIIAARPAVAFELSTETPPYRGVRGRGIAHIVPELGAAALETLLRKFTGGLDHGLAQRLLADVAREVAIVIEPTWRMTWDYSARMKGIAAPVTPPRENSSPGS